MVNLQYAIMMEIIVADLSIFIDKMSDVYQNLNIMKLSILIVSKVIFIKICTISQTNSLSTWKIDIINTKI